MILLILVPNSKLLNNKVQMIKIVIWHVVSKSGCKCSKNDSIFIEYKLKQDYNGNLIIRQG